MQPNKAGSLGTRLGWKPGRQVVATDTFHREGLGPRHLQLTQVILIAATVAVALGQQLVSGDVLGGVKGLLLGVVQARGDHHQVGRGDRAVLLGGVGRVGFNVHVYLGGGGGGGGGGVVIY